MVSVPLFAQKVLPYSYLGKKKMEDGRFLYFDKGNEKEKPLNGEYRVEGGGMKRDSYYIAKYKKGFVEGIMTDYDGRGRKTAEHVYDKGFMTVKREFDYEGNIKRETHFKNNLLNGSDTQYFTDGSISHQTYYKQGKQDGTEISYNFETRKLSSNKNYVDGVQDGKQFETRTSNIHGDYTIESVYDMGQIISQKEVYDNSQLKKTRETNSDGSYTEKSYLREGAPDSEFNYNKGGQMEGVQTYYYPHGSIKITSPYRNGQKDGIRKEYYENGQLKAEESYSDGDKHGAWNEYYPDGQKKTEWLCERNRYNGPYKIYYDNGQIQEEGETKYEEYVFRKIYYKNGQLKSHMVQDSARGLIEMESYDQDGKQL